MAQAQTDPYLKALTASSAAQMAPYGATGSGFMDAIRPVLGFMNGAYQAYAANPRAGGTLIPGLAGMADSMARNQYMKQLQQQAAYERQVQEANQMGRSDLNMSVLGQGFNGIEVPEHMLKAARATNQNPFTNAMLQGKPLQAAQYGDIDPEMTRQYMKQMGDVANNQATMGMMSDALNQGYNRQYGSPQQSQPTQPGTYTDPASGAVVEPMGDTLQAGAQYVPQPQFPVNPFTVGTVDPAKYLDALGKGETAKQNFETNARGVFANTETARHNKADEGIRRSIFGATVKGLGGYGHAPQQPTAAWLASQNLSPQELKTWLLQGGGSSNPYAQDVSRLNAIKSQNDVIDNALMDLGAFDPKTKGIRPEMMSNPQVQSLLSQKASLRNQMMGGGTPSQGPTQLSPAGQAYLKKRGLNGG